MATIQLIRGCIFLLANALGEAWNSASKETSARMVLVVLARYAGLTSLSNDIGWKLVGGFVIANRNLAAHLSPRTMGEILSRRAASRAALPASCA